MLLAHKNTIYSHRGFKIVNLVHNLRIVDYCLGHTGSVHDSYAFESTRIYREHDQLLRPYEWIWADSAYPCHTWCVPPFKKPPNQQLTSRQKKFNYYLAMVRVRSEHTIGLLKGRFQSLRELRLLLSSDDNHDWIVVWIRCCIILHNMIIDIEGENEDAQWRHECVAEEFGQFRQMGDFDVDFDDDSMDDTRLDADEFLPESARAGFDFRETLVDEVLARHYPHLL